jgi:hypothetical protein
MGQIGGTMAYASGRVALQVKIGIAFMASSIVVSYYVMAGAEAPLPGLDLGSQGLAGKMVVMQILSVNALAFYLSRSLGIKFDWLFQPAAALACLAAGLIAHTVSQSLFDVSSQLWLAFLVAGLFYAMILLTLINMVPSLAGLQRGDILAAMDKGRRLVRRVAG